MDIDQVLDKVFSKYIGEVVRQQMKALAPKLSSGVQLSFYQYTRLIAPTGLSTIVPPLTMSSAGSTLDIEDIYVDFSLDIPEVRDYAQATKDFTNLLEWVHNSKTPIASLCEILPSPVYSRVFGSDTRNVSNSRYSSVDPDIKAILDRLLIYEILS